MRFVHTSDLHLGRKLSQMSLEPDTEHMLNQLVDLVERADAKALVVAGDVYESPSPAEYAVRQWDRFITRMAHRRVPVLVVSGNHDSGARLAVGADIIATSGVHIAGELRGELRPVTIEGVNFWLIPFVRPIDVRVWAISQELDADSVINNETAMRLILDHVRSLPEFAGHPNVCVTHQFVTNAGLDPERSDSEQLSLGTIDKIDARVFDGFDYVALGHVHGPQKVRREEIRYAGSPLKLSASEVDQYKSFVVVGIRTEDGVTRVRYRQEPFVPLRDFRVERGSVEELVRRGKQEDERTRQDFVHAVITDDDPLDVVARLRHVWPNIEAVTFDNAITRAAGVDEAPKEVDLEKDMNTLFQEFYKMQAGKPMDDDEAKLVRDAFEKVLANGGDVV